MWLCVLASLAWPGPGRATAQDNKPNNKPSTVLVVRVQGDDNIVLRLRAELSSYRFRVVELPASRRTEALPQLAQERDAQAALRAKPEAMAVELWVRASGAGARTNEELVNAGPGRDPTVLAVRVTEAMRARGLVLPPLLAAGAGVPGSSRRAPTGADGAGPPQPSEAVEDVEPAQPTVLPPDAVPPTAPTPDPKRAELERERKAAGRNADTEGTTEPERKADAEHKNDTERQPDADRKPDGERKADAERKAPAARKVDAERKSEADRKTDAERTADVPAQRPVEAQRTRDENTQPTNEREPSSGPTRARNALLYAEVGPAGVWSPGTNRLGPALDVFVSVKFRPNQSSSISLVGLIPLLSTDFTTGDGAAIEVLTFGIGGFGDLHLPLGPVELNVGIGGMALLSSILPVVYNANETTQRLAALLGRVGASFSLTADLRLGASLMVGLAVRDLRLQFVDAGMERPEVRWGTPLLTSTLSLELALPWDR